MSAARRSKVLGAVAALLAGCPINPTISPIGLSCDDATDPCPSPGYSCVNGSCQLAAGGGGTTGGAPTVCSLPDGGARPPGSQSSFGACTQDDDCVCGMDCVSDPTYSATRAAGLVCEEECATSADCVESLNTACHDGHCALNLCGVSLDGGPANGTLDGACSSEDAGDGTCEPAGTLPAGGAAYGYCDWAGDAGLDGTCGGVSRISSIVCRQGLVCTGTAATGAQFCQQLCSATEDDCPSNQHCQQALGPISTCQ